MICCLAAVPACRLSSRARYSATAWSRSGEKAPSGRRQDKRRCSGCGGEFPATGESGRANGPRDDRPQHGIAIVQAGYSGLRSRGGGGNRGRRRAAASSAARRGPRRCSGRPSGRRARAQAGSSPGSSTSSAAWALIFARDLPPKALAQRQRARAWAANRSAWATVGGQRQHHAHRQVAAVAGDEYPARGRQPREHRLGVGHLGMGDHDDHRQFGTGTGNLGQDSRWTISCA